MLAWFGSVRVPTTGVAMGAGVVKIIASIKAQTCKEFLFR